MAALAAFGDHPWNTSSSSYPPAVVRHDNAMRAPPGKSWPAQARKFLAQTRKD
jgi:hypothetical protein